MQKISLLLLLLGLCALCNATCNLDSFAVGTAYHKTFTRCESLHRSYDLYWSVEGNDLKVGIFLSGIQQGWAGFGVSLNGGMRGADITVVRYDGKWNAEDRFVPGKEGMPKLDVHQDVKLLHASSSTEGSTLVFTRPINPCDIDEDKPILNNGTQIIFAFGQGGFGYHDMNRGSKTVFFHYVEQDPLLPSDSQTFNIASPDYEIPAQETTYACSYMELPSQDDKSHIIRWRPVIKPGNEMHVHHILVFVCPVPKNVTNTYQCGMAPTDCQNIMLAWSLGQYGDDWTKDYALPIGGLDGAKHVVLQVHYNNPQNIAGIIDNSGLSITYTKALKTFEIGSMILSSKFSGLVIPAKQEAFEQWGECPSECTKKLDHPIQLVNYFPHMHEVGVKIWVQQIRDGVELPEIHRDNNYDFQRQQSYSINITVLPGDRLRIHCVWNTMSRNNITIGGEATKDEMCAGYFQYYPSQITKFTACSNFGNANIAICTPLPYKPIPVVPYANLTYIPLPDRTSTCVDDVPTPIPAATTGAQNFDNSSVSLFVTPFLVLLSFVVSMLLL